MGEDDDGRRPLASALRAGLGAHFIGNGPLQATFGGVLREASDPFYWDSSRSSERDAMLVPVREVVARLAPIVGTPALARFQLEDLLAGGRLGPLYAKSEAAERWHYRDGDVLKPSPLWEFQAPSGVRIADEYPEFRRRYLENAPPPVFIFSTTERGVATYRSDEEENGEYYLFTLKGLAVHSAAVDYITDASGTTPLPTPEDLRPKGRPPLDAKDEAIAAVVPMLRRGEFRRRSNGEPVKKDVQQAIAEQLGREPKLRDDGSFDFDTTVRRYADEAIERYRRGK